MKKILLLFIVFSLALCVGCADTPDVSVPEVSTPETSIPDSSVPEPSSHSCETPCTICNLCTNAACSESPCLEKCAGHAENPFSNADYISSSPISIETDTFVYDIGENVYIPGNLEDLTHALEATMEKVSGLDFDGTGYARWLYPDGKIHIDVSRDSLYSWDGILPTSEVGNAYANAQSVTLSPGDLFLGNSKAIVHELGHVLMFRQSEWFHCQLLNEGFAEYTAYLAMLEFDKLDGKVGFSLDRPNQSIVDMIIFDYDKLYEKPLEYWFENTFEYSGNANYVIGFRFMAYLHETFGEYSKWITEFENAHNYNTTSGDSNNSSVTHQIEVLKAVYGEDVLDNFYPWLKANVDKFDESLDWTTYRDLKAAKNINLYPTFNAFESRASIVSFEYQNLYINIDSLRYYLSEYKELDSSGLILLTSAPVKVELYYADGSCSTIRSDSDTLSEAISTPMLNGAEPVSTGVYLDDVSYIKLVGEGTLDYLEIYGEFTQHPQF